MTRRTETIPVSYFDDLYTANADPWRFRTSSYERDKYAQTLAMLDRARFGSVLEIGCSVGVFTRLLAPRCDRLLAIDGSQIALDAAREECRAVPHVSFLAATVPEYFPAGSFDLIVMSEVLYYLTAEDVAQTAKLARNALGPAGRILCCHWLGETDYPLTEDAAVAALAAALGPEAFTQDTQRHDAYRLDIFRPRP